MPTPPKVLALDFDGTLVESVGIKDRAFEALYAEHPEQLPQIMAYHLAHNHTIRFEKFAHIRRHILGLPDDPEALEAQARRFSELVFAAIVACPMVAGARELLEHFHGRTPLYLVSMSPAEEFSRILAARGLAGYFKGVYAHPWAKADALRDILAREQVRPDEAAYVGDAPEDRDAAAQAGVRFLGRDSGRKLMGPSVHDDLTGALDNLCGARPAPPKDGEMR